MKTMSVREFLRGEYKTVTEPTMVMSYSTPIGIWQPLKPAEVTYTSSSAFVHEVEWKPEPKEE